MSLSFAGEKVDQVSTGPDNVTITSRGRVLEFVRQAQNLRVLVSSVESAN